VTKDPAEPKSVKPFLTPHNLNAQNRSGCAKKFLVRHFFSCRHLLSLIRIAVLVSSFPCHSPVTSERIPKSEQDREIKMNAFEDLLTRVRAGDDAGVLPQLNLEEAAV